MKFLLITLGTIGDLLPFMAVAEALRQRGHKIVIASNAGYAALVQGAGFEFAAIWDRPQRTLDDTLGHDPQRAWQMVREEMFAPAMAPTCEFIAHAARGEKCVILASWSAFGARLAHEKLGLPLCSIYLSPHAIREDRPRAASGGAPARTAGFFPEWFAGPQDDVSLTGFPMFDDAVVPSLPDAVETFLRDGPPPILFTPGSFMRKAEDFFREALAASEQMGMRAIFLTPYSDQIPATLPSSVRHFKYVALQRLAPRSAALVHHGGIGTCAQALRAGVAQLVTPVFFDQFDNADRIAALGVGQSVQAFERGEITTRLQTLLQSAEAQRHRAQVKALFDGADPVADICRIAETLA